MWETDGTECDLPTWIHGDEDAACLAKLDLSPLEQEPLGIVGERLQDGQDLLGHHRQHFNVNTIELVKAAPGSRLCGRNEKGTLVAWQPLHTCNCLIHCLLVGTK